MLNLIKKDLIIQKTQLLLLIPFILFFALFADHISAFIVFFLVASYVPLNGYIYDEMVESNMLLNSLPYTRKEIVTAKYIGTIVYMMVGIALACLIFFIVGYDFMFRDIVIAIEVTFFFSALAFPLFYVLKPGYIGTAILVAVVVCIAVLPPVYRLLEKHNMAIIEFLTNTPTTTLYLAGAAISVGFYAISWVVSQFIYQRKVF